MLFKQYLNTTQQFKVYKKDCKSYPYIPTAIYVYRKQLLTYLKNICSKIAFKRQQKYMNFKRTTEEKLNTL